MELLMDLEILNEQPYMNDGGGGGERQEDRRRIEKREYRIIVVLFNSLLSLALI